MTEREHWRAIYGQVLRMQHDPIAPSSAPDRLDAIERGLRSIGASVRAGHEPDRIELHRLAVQAITWALASEHLSRHH